MMAGPSPQHSNGVGHVFKGCSSISQYEVLEKLGEGTFGVVHKAKSKKNGAVVALKQILMHNEKDGVWLKCGKHTICYAYDRSYGQFPVTSMREIKLLKMISHVNVLSLKEMAIERPKGKERKKAIMYIVTQYFEHDLSGLLENPEIHISVPQIKCYMLQLLEGLRYIHDNHILHRDMKAANLLINNRGVLQIADFGLARHYDDPVPQAGRGGGEARREYTCLVVTRWYRPPELLLQLRRYTTAIDLWGVGCVFGEMFARHPILRGESDIAQIHKIFDLVGSPTEENMPCWSSLPGCEGVRSFDSRPGNLAQVFQREGPLAVSLLSDLLKLDWRKRITAIDALEHPYFRAHPLPAKPHELPQFEDSHELDRRKSRGQKGALPAAPAGGTVGQVADREWGAGPAQQNGGAYASGPPSRDVRGAAWDRGPPGYTNGRASYDGRPPPTANFDRPPQAHHEQRRVPASQNPPPAHRPGWQQAQQPPQQRHEIPPRPPVPQIGSGRPQDAFPNGRGPPPAASRNNVDTYVPSYHEGAGSQARPPREDRRPPRDDREYRDRDHAGGQPYPRDRDRERDRYAGGDRRGSYADRAPPGAAYDDRRASTYDDHGRAGGMRGGSGSSGGGGGGLPYGDRDHRRTRSRSPRRDRDRDYRR